MKKKKDTLYIYDASSLSFLEGILWRTILKKKTLMYFDISHLMFNQGKLASLNQSK